MGVELNPSLLPPRVCSRPVEEIARDFRVDPRIARAVPGFDAPFFQAGLAGYSDGAMRLIARRHGAPFCVTEALLDRTLINGGKGRRKEDPDLIATEVGMGCPHENRVAGLDDHPVAGQIMGTHPDEMAEGSLLLVGMGYEVIDVNLACPVKKIKRRNRGGHFLAHPDDAIALLRAVREAVPPNVVCTVKLRRAYNEHPEMALAFERIFNAAYELGYAWSTVHCRTVEQRYTGPGKWEFLTDLTRRYSDRIIFGSGDIWTVRDIFRMLDICGVQGVSVARGCIGNPWIFSQARAMMRGEPALGPTLPEQRAVLEEHYRLAQVIHGERRTGRHMRKFGIKFSHHHPWAAEVRKDFISCECEADWRRTFEAHYGAAAQARAAEQGWAPSEVTDRDASAVMVDADTSCSV